MSNDNIISIKPSPPFSQTINLNSVKKEIEAWRAAKKNNNDRMPDSLWDKVRYLLQYHSETELLSVLSLTRVQMNREKKLGSTAMTKQEKIPSGAQEEIAFCAANEEDSSFPLAYKPAEAFATNTCVVELYRPDGMLMKIHICTDSFDDLLKAFYKGSQ